MLAEREHELASLHAGRDRAASGRGEVVLVEGPAGIGKTSLLQVVQGWRSDVEVLSAHSSVLEQDFPFGVPRQLLERRLLGAEGTARRTLLAGPAARAEQVLGFARTDDPDTPHGELAASLHSLFWLLVNVVEATPGRLIVLAVDDAQWADPASLQFLAYVGRRIHELPVLLVAAWDPSQQDRDEQVFDELPIGATVVRPAPLTVAAVAKLVEEVFQQPSQELVRACWHATSGNPFLVRELLKAVAPIRSKSDQEVLDAVRAAAPPSVTRAVLLRIGRLPEPAPRLAIAASILGNGAALRHAAALAGTTPGAAEQVADGLVAASVLASVHPLRFEHPLVCTAIANDIAPAERAALHRRAAELLREAGEPAERVVPHLIEAAPADEAWVVETLRRTAAGAMERGAPTVAARLLRRAVAEPPGQELAQVLAELALAELRAGSVAESAGTFARALDAAPTAADRTAIRLSQVWAVLAAEGPAAAARSLEAGLVDLGPGDRGGGADPQAAMAYEATLAMQYTFENRPNALLDRLDRYCDVPGHTPAEGFVLAVLAQQSLRQDQPCERTRELALRALGASEVQSEARHAAIAALIDADAYEDARAVLDAGLADAAARSSPASYRDQSWLRGVLAEREGDLAPAEAYARAAVDSGAPPVAHSRTLLALVLFGQGDVSGARTELERVDEGHPTYVWGPYVRGLVMLAEGRAADALTDFEDVGRHATRVGGFAAGLPWQAHAALALHALGDQAGAERAAGEQLDQARRRGAPTMLGVALRVWGLVATGEARLMRLTEAVDVLKGSGARLELARARCDLGVALLRAGQRSPGRDVLGKGLEGARACGARELAKTAYQELKVAGARPRRFVSTGVASLTASERRVADLAAQRLTNNEIAQALFVTPKTVENHLTRIYTKLHVSSRRALADELEKSLGEGVPQD